MRSKSEKRQCEPQKGKAPWLLAAPGGAWIPLPEAGAGSLVLCAMGQAPKSQSFAAVAGVRCRGSLPSRELPSLSACLPSSGNFSPWPRP